jgi:hypothetical protein
VYASVELVADADTQHHMPVLPNVQVELEAAYRKTIPQAKK